MALNRIPLPVRQQNKAGRQGIASSGDAVSGEIAKPPLKPATLAVLVQIGTLALVLGAAFSAYTLTPYKLPVFALVLMQGVIAAILSRALKMAVWWQLIHLFFPIAVWGMSSWQIPSDIYLIGFLISLSLYWTTFRTQVPFYPSRPVVWQQVARLIPQGRAIRMIDIGSGLGDLVMHIAKARPESCITGIEIAPLPYAISKVRGWLKKSTAGFVLGDYRELDFSRFDVVFAYLSPAAMPALWEKASREMSPGSMLISFEFDIPGAPHARRVTPSKNSPPVYIWQF